MYVTTRQVGGCVIVALVSGAAEEAESRERHVSLSASYRGFRCRVPDAAVRSANERWLDGVGAEDNSHGSDPTVRHLWAPIGGDDA